MPIRETASIDALYAATSDADLVLTVDAPLALALNRRVDRPRLGRFAATPQSHASGDRRPMDRRELFEAVATGTELSWRRAGYLVDAALSCWETTGNLDAIRTYPAFDTPAMETVLDMIRSTETAHGALADTQVDPEQDLVVIAEDQFTTLDAGYLPGEDAYRTVSPFTDEEAALEELAVFDGPTAAAQGVLRAIDEDNADDVCIVVAEGSEYQRLIEAGLAARDIPYIGGPSFNEDDAIRLFLRATRLALQPAGLRVGDIRPLAPPFGCDVPSTAEELRLDAAAAEGFDAALEPLHSYFATARSATLGEAMTAFATATDLNMGPLRTELAPFDILDSPIDAALLQRVEYLLTAVEPPVDHGNEGVLLATAGAAAYADRPTMFHLGLDADWTRGIPDWPWIDPPARDAQHLAAFEMLLRSGERRHLCVVDSRQGERVPPCSYLQDLHPASPTRFTDLPHRRYSSGDLAAVDGFDPGPPPVDPGQPPTRATVSKSSLESFLNCPLDYLFERVLPTPDRPYFRRGNLVHDYAEAYAHAPDAVAAATDDLIREMTQELSAFSDDHDLPLEATTFRVLLENVRSFINAYPAAADGYAGYSVNDDPNWVEAALDLQLDEGTFAEAEFANTELGLEGKVDYLPAVDHLVDYKTGRGGTQTGLADQDFTTPVAQLDAVPDLQAPAYLAHHAAHQSDTPITFRYVHLRDNEEDVIRGQANLEDTYRSLQYLPWSLDTHLRRDTMFEWLRSDAAPNDCQKTFQQVEPSEYYAALNGLSLPPKAGANEIMEESFGETFHRRIADVVGDYVYVETGCTQAVRQFVRERDDNYFEDDLAAFTTFARRQLTRLNDCARDGFPAEVIDTDLLTNPDLIATYE